MKKTALTILMARLEDLTANFNCKMAGSNRFLPEVSCHIDSVKLPLLSLLLAFILSEEFVRAIGLKIRRKHLSIRLSCLCKCFELFSKTFC